jgi:biotin carboxylase
MNKAHLLLIAQPNSYRIAPYIKAAQTLGLEVLVASRGEHSLVSEVNAGLRIDIDDHDAAVELIYRYAQKRPFIGVLGSDDSTVELAARVAEKLRLPHNPPAAAKLSRRKDLARSHLSQAGCPVPPHWLIDLRKPLQPQLAGLAFPCVIKPLHLSASKGVIRANNATECIAACGQIKNIIAHTGDAFECSHVLIEQYIDGVEVAFEGYLHAGQLHKLVIFDKPEPLIGPYFEETIYVTPSQLDAATQRAISHCVAQACQAYGLVTGPVHAELRIDHRHAWVLEVASRTIGGDCARSLDQGSEFNLEQLAVSLAIGEPLNSRPPQQARGVMMMPIKQAGILRRVEGLAAARKVKYVDKVDIIIRQGNELIALPEGNQYPGYIFARAKTRQQVIDALRQSFNELNFVVAPVIKPVLIN